MEQLRNASINTDSWEDPLAVKVGLHADEIPAEGWPDTFKPEIVKRILGYLTTENTEVN